MIIQIAIVVLYLVVLAIAISCHIHVSRAVKEIEHILDHNARITKVLAEHEQKFDALTVNEPKDDIDDLDKKEKKADNDYNEGMNNIFGYSVNTGIKVGDE